MGRPMKFVSFAREKSFYFQLHVQILCVYNIGGCSHIFICIWLHLEAGVNLVHLLSACSSNTHTMHRSGLVPVRYKLYCDLLSSVLLLALFSSALLQFLALPHSASSDVLMGLMCTRALWPRAQSDMLHVIALVFALHMAMCNNTWNTFALHIWKFGLSCVRSCG